MKEREREREREAMVRYGMEGKDRTVQSRVRVGRVEVG